MNRKTFRIILVALLLISAAFAAWSWMRPYEWAADSAAELRIAGCFVEQDHSNYWVNLELKVPSGGDHDMGEPVHLLTSSGDRLELADIVMERDEDESIRRIWVKFWVEKEHFEGPLELKINEGSLKVRSGSGLPKLRNDGNRYFVTHAW